MMNSEASISLDNNCLLVSGEIDFRTAVNLWSASLPLLAQCKMLSFDFSSVTKTNSAALALLLEWIKYAGSQQKQIVFQHLPAQLMSVAKVAGIEDSLSSYL